MILVIVIVLFIIEIISLRNFVDNSRQKFYDLIENYPDGTPPDNLSLVIFYLAIRNGKCCGIDNNKNLTIVESRYYYRNFAKNCLKWLSYFSTHPKQVYQ